MLTMRQNWSAEEERKTIDEFERSRLSQGACRDEVGQAKDLHKPLTTAPPKFTVVASKIPAEIQIAAARLREV